MFLFVTIPNNSGSTMVLQMLATSPNVSCLKKEIWFDRDNPVTQTNTEKLEGKDVRLVDRSDYVANYMPVGAARSFTEEEAYFDPESYDWETIKKFWYKSWDLMKPVKIEKTPDNVLKAWAIAENIHPSKFIVAMRDPYAFCNSMRRYAYIEQACEHWIRCAKQQIWNIENLDCYWTTYERMCGDPSGLVADLMDFVPELGSLEQREMESRNTTKLLTTKELEKIEERLVKDSDCVEFFGYRGDVPHGGRK